MNVTEGGHNGMNQITDGGQQENTDGFKIALTEEENEETDEDEK